MVYLLMARNQMLFVHLFRKLDKRRGFPVDWVRLTKTPVHISVVKIIAINVFSTVLTSNWLNALQFDLDIVGVGDIMVHWQQFITWVQERYWIRYIVKGIKHEWDYILVGFWRNPDNLTQRDLVTPYGHIDLDRHWFWEWHAVGRY